MDSVLEIKNLLFYYKKENLIFNNFNLELKKGELKTVFGKSGSGKTTLFEIILGNLKAQKAETLRSFPKCLCFFVRFFLRPAVCSDNDKS